MDEHDNSHHQNGTALLDHDAAQNDTAQNDTHADTSRSANDAVQNDNVNETTPSGTTEPGAAAVQNGTPRKASRSNRAKAKPAVALGDLPAALHRHVTRMGAEEAAHALATLRSLAKITRRDDRAISPEWLAALGAAIEACRNKPAIERLVAALGELLPAVAHPENEAAVDALLSFIDSQVRDAQIVAQRRKDNRK